MRAYIIVLDTTGKRLRDCKCKD